MNPSHHPSEAILVDHTLGLLPEPFGAVIGAHVGVCTQCRETIASAELIGSELISALSPVGVSAQATAVFDDEPAVDEPGSLPAVSASRADQVALHNDLERVVQTYLASSLDALPWKRVGGGLKICRLAEADDTRMWMLRGEPGVVLPEHRHGGTELTLVLRGAYFCGSEIFRAGDIEDADESVEHQPVITRDGECICLAVTEGPLQFRRWLPRLAQSYIGI